MTNQLTAATVNEDVLVSQLVEGRNLANQWSSNISNLMQSNSLDDDWVPIMGGIQRSGDTTQIPFVNGKTGESRTLEAESDAYDFNAFPAYYNKLLSAYAQGYAVDEEGNVAAKPNVSGAQAVYSLTAGMLINQIADLAKQGGIHSDGTAYRNAVAAQTIVGLTKKGLGILSDANKLAKTVSLAMESESKITAAIGKSVDAVGGLVKVAGPTLEVINLGLDVAKFINATNEKDRAASAASLGIDCISGAVTAGSLVAEMAGAAAVSDVLGPLGVPLAGLSIGVGALVGNFEALKANADHTVEVFTKISDAVNNKGFTVDKGVLKAMPGAVITEINLLNKTVTFGDMTIQPSTSVTNDMPAGGWDGFALGGPHEDAHGTPLSIYEGLGLEHTATLKGADEQAIILPSSPERNYTYQYHVADGERYNWNDGKAALQTLRDHYSSAKFVWAYYLFPSDYAIQDLTPHYKDTKVNVVLDKMARDIIVPTLSDDIRHHMSYTLTGDGGQYNVILPEQGADITIATTTASGEIWRFDINNLTKNSHSDLINNIYSNISYNGKRFILGGQTIEFKGPGPKAINLVDHIGNNGVLALQLNTQGQVCASAISVEYKNPPSGADFDKLSQYIAGSGLKALGDVPVAVTIDNVDGGKITFDMSLENRKATNVNVSLSFGDDRTRNMALDPSDLAKIKSVISQINDVHFGSFANAKIEWSGNKFDGLFDLADGLFIGTTSAKSNGLVMVDLHMVDGRVKGLIETSFQGTVNRVYEEQGKLMTQINVAGSTLTYSFQHQGDTIQSGTFGLEMINASSSLMDRLIGAGIDKLSTDELDRTLSTNGLGHANVEVHTLYNGNISAGHLAQTTSQTIHILGRDSLNRQLLIDASDNGATLLGGSWSSDNVDYQILGSTMIVTPKAQQGIVTLDETQLSGLGLSGVVIDATQIKGNINLSQDLLKANNISVVLSGGQDTLTLDGLESSQVKFGIDGDKLVLTEDATQHQVRISGVNGSVLTDKALITFADKSVSLRDITTGIGQLHDNPDGVHSYSLAFLSEKKSTQSAFHEKAIAGVDMSTMSAAQQHQLLVQAMGEMGAPGSADDTHIGIEPATNQSNPLAMTH